MKIIIKSLMLFLIFIVKRIFCWQYQIPPLTQYDYQNIRLDSIQYLSEPKAIELNKIYRRQVYQVAEVFNDANKPMTKPFLPCQQSSPQIKFKNFGYFHLDQISNPYWKNQSVTNSSQPSRKPQIIIYDFEVLKSKYRNIIDMVFYDDHIFTISSTAVINIYRLNSETQNGIQVISTLKGIDWQLLNKKRIQDWQKGQDDEKERMRQIQDQSQSQDILQTNQTGMTQISLGDGVMQDNQAILKSSDEQQKQNTNSNNKTDSSNLESNSNKSRFLQQTKPSVQQQATNSPSEPRYFTVPPPQPIAPYLSKGYFQFLDEHRLLIYSNDQYLIGMDVKTFKPILLSQQIRYQELFQAETKRQNQTNTSPTQDEDRKDLNNLTKTNDPSINQTTIEPTKQNKPSNTSSAQNAQHLIIGMEQPAFKEYLYLQNFQEITKIDQRHFAVLDKKRGVIVYEVIKKRLNQSSTQQTYYIKRNTFINKEAFGKSYREDQQMGLVDIQYNQNKSLLIVLDYEKGVFAFDRQYVQTMDQQQNSFTLSPDTIMKRMCNLMQFSQGSQTLYLCCNKIYRVSLVRWPRIEQRTFPHPLINIREIFIEEQKNILILAGYSVFKVMYLDRTTSYFQDDMLDKIIFHNDLVITANQNHIIALQYAIEKPMILCQPNNRSQLGVHNLVLKTTAQCSQPYLKSINFTKPNHQQSFDSSDVCVYTVYKSIYIWQQGQMPIKPLAIVLLLFLIFLVVMIIWFVVVRFRVQRAEQHLKYLCEQGQDQLVEEDFKSQMDVNVQIKSNQSQPGRNQQEKYQNQQKNEGYQGQSKNLYPLQ